MGSVASIERVILFDGVCNLCSASVRFVIRRDKQVKFRFASLQSEFAKKRLPEMKGDGMKTIVLLKSGRTYFRSDAALEISRELAGLWPALYAFKIIPLFLRDFIYNFISRNRYRWFGKKEECWIPAPEWSARFVD